MGVAGFTRRAGPGYRAALRAQTVIAVLAVLSHKARRSRLLSLKDATDVGENLRREPFMGRLSAQVLLELRLV